MALAINNTAFWPVMPCSLETAPLFGGTSRLHINGAIVSHRKKPTTEILSSCSAVFLLNLFFDPED
jgi:hypothetical protein